MKDNRETKINHVYHLTWPEGTQITMDERSLQQIKDSLEHQFREAISKSPGFDFFHSIGNTNFFQHFKTADGLDFGVCHLYWDGSWKIRWLPAGCYEPIGKPNPISEEGWRIIDREISERISQSTIKTMQAHIERQEQDLPAVDEEKKEVKPKYLN